MAPLAGADRVARVLADRLRDDPGLAALGLGQRVYRDLAPARTAYPLVVFAVMASVDLTTLAGAHVWSDVQVLVKVIGQNAPYETLIPPAERVAELLDGYRFEAEGVRAVKLRRISSPPQPPDVESGVLYRYVNQLFETEVAPL